MDETTGRLAQRLKSLADLEKRLPFRLVQLGNLLEMQSSRLLADHGIDTTGYRTLMLAGIFGSASIADLARTMAVNRDRVSRAVTRLQSQGWIETATNPADNRQILIVLTQDGADLLKTVEPLFDQRRELLEAQLTTDEAAALRSAVSKLSDFLDENADRRMPGLKAGS